MFFVSSGNAARRVERQRIRMEDGYCTLSRQTINTMLIPRALPTDTTDSSFTFDPLAILMSFPTQYSNISSGEAIAATHDVSNYLRISQPNATSDSQRAPALTDQFLVHTGWTEEFVRNVQAFDANLYGQQQRNWQIGVGAGIGIGLPLIVVLSWFMGHRLGTKAGYELAAKVARRREVREMS